MKWFLYHILFSILVYYGVKNFYLIDYSKPLNFLAVMGLVFLVTWLITIVLNRNYFLKLPRIINFIFFLLKEVTVSNLRIVYDILTPRHRMNPAIIAVPLDLKSDYEIVALAILITFTPGTLGLKVSDDKKILYVHEMYIPDNDVEAIKRKIKNEFERKIKELSR